MTYNEHIIIQQLGKFLYTGILFSYIYNKHMFNSKTYVQFKRTNKKYEHIDIHVPLIKL